MAGGSPDAPPAPIAKAGNGPGILAMLAGTACFTGNDTIVKLLGGQLPPGEIMLLRGLIAAVMLAAAAQWFGVLRLPRALLLNPAFGLRLIGEIGSTITFIVSLMHLRFADASGIQQFQPLAVTAASALFLAEPVGWRRWLAALAGLVGVLMIVKPGTGAFNPYAVLASSCVVFVALRDLATRAVPAGVPFVVIALSSAVAVMAGGLLLAPFESWSVPGPDPLLSLGVAALFLVGGYMLVTISVRVAPLSVVSPFRYAGVIFAVLLQVAIWGLAPDALTVLGIFMVVVAGLYTLHRERVRYLGRS